MTVEQAISYLQTPTFSDPTEPVFVLRGRDSLAAHCVLSWINQAERNGVNRAKIVEAGNVMERFLSWNEKRLPD